MVEAREEEMEAGGLEEAPAPTIEQCLQQAHDQIMQMRTQYLQLQQKLENEKKGKTPNRGRCPYPGP